MMLVVLPSTGRQNKLPPQFLQNPRSAEADERYQVSVADEANVIASFGALVAAT
jgi:hypothetical protein